MTFWFLLFGPFVVPKGDDLLFPGPLGKRVLIQKNMSQLLGMEAFWGFHRAVTCCPRGHVRNGLGVVPPASMRLSSGVSWKGAFLYARHISFTWLRGWLFKTQATR